MVPVERSFGYLLRRYRLAALLTQEKLAERAHLSYRTISDLERGVKHTPRRDTVLLLAGALELSPQERATLMAATHPLEQPEATRPAAEHGVAAVSVRTFLIANIRGYARFTETQGDEAAARLTNRFVALVGEYVEGHEGRLVETRGDEVLAVFSSARQALRAAADLQARLEREAGPGLPLQIGVGLDAGEAVPVNGGYRGGALNLAARLCGEAGPGEVLTTETVVHLARKIAGIVYQDRGPRQLQGLSEPVRVIAVQAEASGKGAATTTPASAVPSTEPRYGTPPPTGGFLGALPLAGLVARAQELDEILSAIDDAEQGSGRLALLAGEPGAGKTRLAQEATVLLRDRGFLVTAGSCYEPHQAVPFYPLLDALTAAYAAAPRDVRVRIPGSWPHLGRLLPELAHLLPAASRDRQEEHLRLCRAVTGFLQAIATELPLALLLDDLQWADTASLDLLQQITRHSRGFQLFLLGTFRDVEAEKQPAFRRLVRDLHRERLVRTLAIGRLGQDGTRALMTARMGGQAIATDLAELVHHRTEGNPFFIEEVVRALIERNELSPQSGQQMPQALEEIDVPKTVRDVLHERVSRVSTQAQEILREASVLGQTFSFDALRLTGNRPEADVEAALDEAIGAGLIREADLDAYAFNHALTQQTLYDDLSTRGKRRLHLSAATALEQLPERTSHERAATLTWHYQKGGDPARALTCALIAGGEAERVFAHEEAEHHYRTALGLAREIDDAPREAEAAEKVAKVLMILARYDETIELLAQAARRYRDLGDPEAEARVVAQLGRVHSDRGTTEEGIAYLEGWVDTLGPADPSPGLAGIQVVLARLYFFSSRYAESLVAAERARDLARVVGDSMHLAEAESRRSSALQLVGRVEEAIAVAEDTVTLVEASEDNEMLCRALHTAAVAYLFTGQLPESRARLERAFDLAKRHGHRGLVALVEPFLCDVCFHLGDWERAQMHGERALDTTRSFSSWYAAHALGFLGRLHLAQGNWEVATRHLEESAAMAERFGNDLARWWAQAVLGERDVLSGHASVAVARLRPLLPLPGAYGAGILPVLGWAHLELGDRDQAQEIALMAVERTRAEQTRLILVDALRVLGMVQAERGAWADAERHFEEAVTLAQDMSSPYAEGRILYEYGLSHTSRQQPEQARPRLAGALEIFRWLGAAKDIERTQKVLASLGQRSAAPSN